MKHLSRQSGTGPPSTSSSGLPVVDRAVAATEQLAYRTLAACWAIERADAADHAQTHCILHSAMAGSPLIKPADRGGRDITDSQPDQNRYRHTDGRP